MPDSLWRYKKFGEGKKYSDNQAEDMAGNVFAEFDEWTKTFADFVAAKGKVEPGKYRAFGYKAPGHLWEDLKLKWREHKMKTGDAPEGSSPAQQEKLDLTHDTGRDAKKAEGEKLRR